MWICTRCGEDNEEATRTCAACGAGAWTCETCGAPAKGARCEACGFALSDRAPGRIRRVWSSTNPVEAELLRVELRRAGIESVLENEGGAAYAIGLATPLVPLVISVAEAHVAKALEVLRDARDRAPAERYIPPVAMVTFPCGCGKELEVPPDFKGLAMECPFCGRPVTAG